jgi:hypothetical protein
VSGEPWATDTGSTHRAHGLGVGARRLRTGTQGSGNGSLARAVNQTASVAHAADACMHTRTHARSAAASRCAVLRASTWVPRARFRSRASSSSICSCVCVRGRGGFARISKKSADCAYLKDARQVGLGLLVQRQCCIVGRPTVSFKVRTSEQLTFFQLGLAPLCRPLLGGQLLLQRLDALA